jgi:uncharacterized protein (TIGR03066 family)
MLRGVISEKQMNNFLRILITFLIIVLSSCSQGLEDRIVGKWQELSEKPNSIEFFDDGKVLITGKSSVEGTWKVLDGERIQMSIFISGVKLSEIMTIEFIDDKIIATNSKGNQTESKRIE